MAYFSNGTEGDMYQERYCSRCANDRDDGCEVWGLHLLYNGVEDVRDVLDMLIPMVETPHGYTAAGECSMFRSKARP